MMAVFSSRALLPTNVTTSFSDRVQTQLTKVRRCSTKNQLGDPFYLPCTFGISSQNISLAMGFKLRLHHPCAHAVSPLLRQMLGGWSAARLLPHNLDIPL